MITLVIDVLKGTAAVVMGSIIADDMGAMVCVIAVFCGHVWPVIFGFKGGKGVATAFGALLGLNPLMALSVLAVVVIFVLITKRMSVGSILGAASFPFISFFMERDFVVFGTILALIVIIKHRANIVRLVRGEEPVMSIFDKSGKDRGGCEMKKSRYNRCRKLGTALATVLCRQGDRCKYMGHR